MALFQKTELMTKLHIDCFEVPLAGWYNKDSTPNIIVARTLFLADAFHAIKVIDKRR